MDLYVDGRILAADLIAFLGKTIHIHVLMTGREYVFLKETRPAEQQLFNAVSAAFLIRFALFQQVFHFVYKFQLTNL